MPRQLCGAEKIYDIQSHYSPRAITESTFGDTDKEEIYTITPYLGSIEEYKGRAVPQDEPEKIKPLPNTGKGIFCKKCETALGALENTCQPLLNDSLEELYTGTLKYYRVREALKAFTIPAPSNILKLFLYSVVWRQCLQNKTHGNSILTENEFSYLQSILLNELFRDQQHIVESKEYSKYPKISIFTSKRNVEKDGWANPSPLATNPELFFLGRYLILYYQDGKPLTNNLYMTLGIPSFLHNSDLSNQNGQLTSRIGLIAEDIHAAIIKNFVRRFTATFRSFHINRVSKHRSISLKEAEITLHEMTLKICKEEDSVNYADFLVKASDLLCS